MIFYHPAMLLKFPIRQDKIKINRNIVVYTRHNTAREIKALWKCISLLRISCRLYCTITTYNLDSFKSELSWRGRIVLYRIIENFEIEEIECIKCIEG